MMPEFVSVKRGLFSDCFEAYFSPQEFLSKAKMIGVGARFEHEFVFPLAFYPVFDRCWERIRRGKVGSICGFRYISFDPQI